MPLDQHNVDRAIAYHGPSLVDQLAREEVDVILPSFLSLPQVGTRKEPDRDQRFDDNLVSFIAKKADLLFTKPQKPPETKVLDDDTPDLYAIVPPLEAYMEVPEELRREQFYKSVAPGDIVIGTITNINEGGLVLTLICFDYTKARDIDSLKIQAMCSVREIPHQSRYDDVMESFKMKDLVRGVVLNASPSPGKFTISLRQDSLPPGRENIILGVIEDIDLPVHYRRLQRLDGASYAEHTQRRLGFSNSSCVPTLCSELGLRTDSRPSLMRGLHRLKHLAEDYAEPLRKSQSRRWALKSVAEGVSYFKQGKYVEAMQYLNKALQMDEDNVEAYVARGALYANNDSYTRALEDFSKALDINPDHPNARNYMCETLVVYARSLVDAGNEEAALRHFEGALRIDPRMEEVRSAVRRLQAKLATSRQDSVIKIDDESDDEERHLREVPPLPTEETETEKTSATLRKLLEEERHNKHKKKKRKSQDASEAGDEAEYSRSRHSSSDLLPKASRYTEEEDEGRRRDDPRYTKVVDDELYSTYSSELPARSREYSRDSLEGSLRSPTERKYDYLSDQMAYPQRPIREGMVLDREIMERVTHGQGYPPLEESGVHLSEHHHHGLVPPAQGSLGEQRDQGREEIELPPWLKKSHLESTAPIPKAHPDEPSKSNPLAIPLDELETLKIRFTNDYAERHGKSSSKPSNSGEGDVTADVKGHSKQTKMTKAPAPETSKTKEERKRSKSVSEKARLKSGKERRSRDKERSKSKGKRRRGRSSSSSSSSSSSRSSSSNSSSSSSSSSSSRSSGSSSRSSSSDSRSGKYDIPVRKFERFDDGKELSQGYKKPYFKGKAMRGRFQKPFFHPYKNPYKIDRRKEVPKPDLKKEKKLDKDVKKAISKWRSNSDETDSAEVKTEKSEKNNTKSEDKGKEEGKKNGSPLEKKPEVIIKKPEVIVKKKPTRWGSEKDNKDDPTKNGMQEGLKKSQVEKVDPKVQFGKWDSPTNGKGSGDTKEPTKKRDSLEEMENFLKMLKQKKATDTTTVPPKPTYKRW